jgi:C1A family cysteine protease
MRFFSFSLLLTSIGVAFATSFSTCATDHLGITSVALSENPVTPGTTLTVSITGTPDQTITSGTVDLNIYYHNVKLYSESFDLCTGIGVTCPLQSGVTFTAAVSEVIPSSTPSLTTTAQVVTYDGSSNELSCISVSVTVGSSSEVISDEAAEFLFRSQFEQYKKDFNKHYESEDEEEIRFFHFKNSIERVAIKNAYGGNVFGLTKFSDMCPEEFKAKYLNYKPQVNSDDVKVAVPSLSATSSFDWRSTGVVTPVKNQGYCGSCWAFSAVETIESAWALAGNTLTTFSEQQVVSCDTTDAGCNGGDTITAYAYIEKAGGLATEANYPYKSSSGVAPACKSSFTISGGQISGYSYATTKCTSVACNNQDEDTLAANLASTQPVSICVDASEWSDYTSGVYPASSCKSGYDNLDHCVQLVGYYGYTGSASTSSSGYWIVRNSWDTDWGVAGYIYLAMGSNTCGVADEATMVKIK